MNIQIEYAMHSYLAIGIAKAILALSDVHVAAGTAHRFNGRPVWQLILVFAVGVMITAMLIWPRALTIEGWRFFLTYSRFGLIRQVVEAYREADSKPSEKLT